MRVAIAALFHETNTFAAQPTDTSGFRAYLGSDLEAQFRGTRTVVGGFLDALADARADAVPTFGAYATPSGTVTRDAFDRLQEHMVDGLQRAGGVDAVLLELHGALVVDGLDDPETVLCAAVREVAGDRPVAAVTDLHANMTPDRLTNIDVLRGYRTNPHVDTYETGVAVARLTLRLIEGEDRPLRAHAGVPLLAAPIAQATAQQPLRRLLDRARELESHHRLLDVTVHGGYAYADVPHAGLSITATGEDGEAVAEVAGELARQAVRDRDEFRVTLRDPEDAFAHAVARVRRADAPIAIADTGDNIGGGSAGDGTWLLHQAVAHDVRCLTTMCDPAALAAALDAGVGSALALDLGGWSHETAGRPVPVVARVLWAGGGDFVNQGPMAHGARVQMGPAARLGIGSVEVVVYGRAHQPNDPEMFRAVGVEPGSADIVLLKGAAALRAGWMSLVTDFVDAATPGVTDCRLERLAYRRLAERAWPVTDIDERDIRLSRVPT